jgi:hypothetical protein
VYGSEAPAACPQRAVEHMMGGREKEIAGQETRSGGLNVASRESAAREREGWRGPAPT